jgi:hypothetical protein
MITLNPASTIAFTFVVGSFQSTPRQSMYTVLIADGVVMDNASPRACR